MPPLIRTDFEKNPDEIEEIPEILEKYLDNVARSGDIVFKWEQFKPLIKKKIQMIATEFNEKLPCDPNLNQPNVKPFEFEEVKRNILNGIDSFTGAPFTIQRICELLTNPYKHYKRADKFLKGLEKNVMVISEETVDQSKTENGNNSGSSSFCLNATFTMPSTSDSFGNNQSTAFHNGFKESQPDDQLLSHQQLDSFSTVFVSSAQTTTSHLERIASLQILEQSATTVSIATTVVNQHTTSSSQLSSIQPFLATTSASRISRVTDPALDSLEKITQEIPVVEQQQAPLVADVIIETVNSEQPAALASNGGSEQLVPAEDDKYLEVSSKADEPAVASEVVVGAVESNGEPQSLSDRIEPTSDSEKPKEDTEVPVREQSAGNDLKRVLEDDEIESADESFKRFKADESAEEGEKASEDSSAELSDLNDSVDESAEQPLEDKKEEPAKIEPESTDAPVSEQQTVESTVQPEQQTDLEATENRPAEPSVTEDSSQTVEQQVPTEPSNERREALPTDASGDKLNEPQPEADLKDLKEDEKQPDNDQEKEN